MNSILNIEKDYKQELDSIWEKNKNLPCVQKGYEARKTIKKHAILFVGINPSCSKGMVEEAQGAHVFLDLEKINEKHSYFSKMFEISRYCSELNDGNNYPWAELDLLNIRETSQTEVRKMLAKEENTHLIEQNLELSLEIMREAQPTVIVVCNAFAREILKKYFTFEFDKVLGTYVIKNDEKLNHVPIFFSSMLSGQRALDLGSFNRLEWHINYVLEKISLKALI